MPEIVKNFKTVGKRTQTGAKGIGRFALEIYRLLPAAKEAFAVEYRLEKNEK